MPKKPPKNKLESPGIPPPPWETNAETVITKRRSANLPLFAPAKINRRLWLWMALGLAVVSGAIWMGRPIRQSVTINPPAEIPAAAAPTPAPAKSAAAKSAPPPRIEHKPAKTSAKPPKPLPPKVDWAYLSLEAKPWAIVYVDQKRLDRITPIYDLKVKAGEHEIRFENPQIKKRKIQKVTLEKGQKLLLKTNFR